MGGIGPGSNDATPPEGRGKCLLERARWPSDAHPQLKLVARESWAADTLQSQSCEFPTPFDPPEFADVLALGAGTDTDGSGPSCWCCRFGGGPLTSSPRAWWPPLCRVVALTLRSSPAVVGSLCAMWYRSPPPPAPCPSISGYEHDAAVASGLHLFELSDSSALE